MKLPVPIICILVFTSARLFAQVSPAADSITIAVHPKYNKVKSIHKTFFGDNYRKIWATPVKMKVFYLNKEKGGLAITGLGGGNQTKSLQLKDSAGHEWALRTVQKYPGKALNKYFKNSIAEDVLQDQVSTSHPYAALTVPPMADALGIEHTNPQMVYLGNDPALGKYQKDFANQVYLFEEREPLDGKKTQKTETIQKKLLEDNDNRADQKMLLRARLLDMIIGDWDRHGDQWRWEKSKDSLTKGNIYIPSPRDRDKVFYSTSGVFPYFAALIKPQLQPFKTHIKNITWWNFNAVNFDLDFLNNMNEQDWLDEIAYVQQHLTNQVITDAIKLLPPNIYAISGKRLTQIVIARRNNIKKDALIYYRFLAKDVDVATSDKNEKFTITQQAGGKITVTINKLKKDSVAQVIYQREFDPKVTKEIRLYGMDGKDVFTVTGDAASHIKVRMIGGDGNDTFDIHKNPNSNKLFVYDRSDQKNNIPTSAEARIFTSADTAVNKYDNNAFKYDYSAPLVSLGYNTDDGVQLIAGYSRITYGFRKEPYATNQLLQIGYTLSRGSVILNYTGDFKKVFGDNNISVNVLSRGIRNVNNFFGLGNDLPFPNSGTKTFDYYRNLYNYTVADVRIYHQYNKWQLSGGVIGQYYNSNQERNQDKFFSEYDAAHPEANLFETKFYAGLVGGLKYDTRKHPGYPTNGVFWNTNITGLTGLNVGHTNGKILSVFSFYFNPGKDSVFVIANRTGFGMFGGKGEFFQQMNLGGILSLQGFHTSRFIGNTIAYNNLELRLKLFDFHNYILPSTIGIIGFNDTGRVWLPGESSDTWHYTYGGGLFIMPYHAFILQAVMGASKDGTLLYLSSGFRF